MYKTRIEKEAHKFVTSPLQSPEKYNAISMHMTALTLNRNTQIAATCQSKAHP
jgi:hypothetical protein